NARVQPRLGLPPRRPAPCSARARGERDLRLHYFVERGFRRFASDTPEPDTSGRGALAARGCTPQLPVRRGLPPARAFGDRDPPDPPVSVLDVGTGGEVDGRRALRGS